LLEEVQLGKFQLPSILKRGLPLALEAVCLKAMAISPADRYASPRLLANDIENWLADEPVSAVREPLLIRALRWAKRHRTLVSTTAVALLVATVLLSVLVMVINTNNNERAYARAREKEAHAESDRQTLTNNYTNLLSASRALDDAELAIYARRGLRKLAMSASGAQENESRLKAITQGAPVHDADEARQLGSYARDTYRYSLATRMFADALERDAELASNREKEISYLAACCAALAADGLSLDEPPLDNVGQKKLRQQALIWLQGELQSWQDLLAADPGNSVPIIVTLKRWQQDSDLVSLRDADALAKLPAPEREPFEALWIKVAELHAKAISAFQTVRRRGLESLPPH
jgi:hypothetical protein